jgi:8-oxo-dGTP pyrophosphatase MutT (NUDIX family)
MDIKNKVKKMIISAGALFKCTSTNRYLFMLRSSTSSYPSRWSLLGGKVHHDERILEGLQREIVEEIGFLPKIQKWIAFNCFTSMDKKFQYHSVLMLTPKEFIPKLNSENDGYAWVNIENPPKPLHPRLREVLTSEVLINSIKNFV